MKKNVFLAKLKDLQVNPTLSSSQIFINLLDLLIKFFQTENINNTLDDTLAGQIISILDNFHPEMAIMDVIKDKIHGLEHPWNNISLNKTLNDIKQENSKLETKVIQKAVKIIKDTNVKHVLTISYSKIVFNTINKLYTDNIIESCTICDSGPKFEGLSLAKDIHVYCPKLNLNIISDAMAPNWILNNHVDAAIFGADVIYSDNSVLNKSGSLGIGLSCAFKKIDCYVIATSLKKRKTLFHQNQLLNQVASDYSWYKKPTVMNYVNYWNYYFDYIPKDLIKLITDE